MLALPVYLGAVHLWYFSLACFFSVLALIYFSLVSWKRGDASDKRTPADAWLVPFLVLYSISACQSKLPYLTLVDTFKLLGILCIFWAAVRFCRDRSSLWTLAAGMVFLGGALSFLGLLQYLGALPKPWWHMPHFLSSTYVNHNHFAGFLEMTLPLSLALAFSEKEAPKKVLFIFLAALMGLAFVFTLSRGGYFSLWTGFAAMILLAAQRTSMRRWIVWFILLVVAVALVAVVFGAGPVMDRIGTLGSISSGAEPVDRLLMWQGALEIIRGNPWFGTGPGTFAFAFLKVSPAGFPWRPVYAHNDYLNLAADCGLLVFAGVILFYARILIQAWRVALKKESRFRPALAMAVFAALAALAAHSFVDFNFHIPANWAFAAALTGMLFSMDREAPRRPVFGQAFKGAVFLLAFVVLAGSLFFGLSDFFLWRAKGFGERGQAGEAIAWAEKSLRVNRFSAEAHYLHGVLSERLGKTAQALESYREAVRLNPYEPYYDLHWAKRYFPGKSPQEAAAHYRRIVEKNPNDSGLLYAVGRELFKIDRVHEAGIEKDALEMFKKAFGIDPLLGKKIYRSLWDYYRNPEGLASFTRGSPAGWKHFIDFLEKNDLWRFHREHYLESLGLDPGFGERLAKQDWIRSGESWTLRDFTVKGGWPVIHGDLFFYNAEIEKELEVGHSRSRVAIVAKGSRAGNSYPYVLILWDGKVIDALYLDSAAYKYYFVYPEAAAGKHILGIRYVNDYVGGTPKRNRDIWIEKVELQYPKEN